jgi:hypothetical protein
MAGKYGDLIKKAREPENQITDLPENQITRTNEAGEEFQDPEPEVNLCIKIPKSLRQHWAAESKRHGTTMTAVIIEALTKRFGTPLNK